MAQILNKDIFQSDFSWSFNYSLVRRSRTQIGNTVTETEEIPIEGLPFKWQLGMTSGYRFDLDFIEDGPLPMKYTKITCDFEVGEYWSGKADLFPTNARKSRSANPSALMSSVDLDGFLEIECRMKVKAYFIESNPSVLAIDYTKSCVMKLIKDIGVLLEDEKHSDVTIVVKDHELKAHKVILAARSKVFSLMFETDMKEKLESRIEFPGVSVEAVEEFLKFLYTGEVSSTQHSKDLLSLAALYQIEDLKEICGQMLITQLNKDNALENLFIANLHNFDPLKEKAFEVITQQILREATPNQLMNKPDAVEKLMLAQLKYDEILQEAMEA